MSEEKAIKIIDESWLFTTNHVLDDENKKFKIAIETVLNMLEKKNEEIERSEVEYHELVGEINRLETELAEKDKIIDLMAEQLAGLSIFDNDIDDVIILGNKEDVKKYFEKKVSE